MAFVKVIKPLQGALDPALSWGRGLVTQAWILVSCPAIHTPWQRTSGGFDLKHLVSNTFLVWNVRGATKSQNTQFYIAMSSKFKDFILRFAIFVRKSELCASALCCFKDWATKNLLISKFKRFASLHEKMMSPAILARVWRIKSGSLPLLSLMTDALMVREHCWLLEGKATQQIKQQIEKGLIMAFTAQ